MKVRICAVLVIAALAATVHTYGANAATASSSATSRTCAAVKIWESHATAANLAAMSADSQHTTGWLRSDVKQLVSDVQAGETKYVPGDERYLSKDCGAVTAAGLTKCKSAIRRAIDDGTSATDVGSPRRLVKVVCSADHLNAAQRRTARAYAGYYADQLAS
jgi:hypothetical protein